LAGIKITFGPDFGSKPFQAWIFWFAVFFEINADAVGEDGNFQREAGRMQPKRQRPRSKRIQVRMTSQISLQHKQTLNRMIAAKQGMKAQGMEGAELSKPPGMCMIACMYKQE
jgi:hypothetical protein